MFGKPKDFSTAGNLIDGLPVPANTMITVYLKPEGFYFQALTGRKKEDWPTFDLVIEKIENVQLMNQLEIQRIIEQSAPGMIIGGAAFGLLGAMVGGRTKTKEKSVNHTIFVIDYQSGGKKQIVLDVTSAVKDSERVIQRFQELKPVQNTTVQL